MAQRPWHSIDQMRLGDLIAIRDVDHRFGRSYRRGWVAICLCIQCDSVLTGHGPGILTLITGPEDALGHPGASIRQADDMKNRGLLTYACVGNCATVMTGQAAGTRGVVTGKSGRFSEQLIVHLPKAARATMAVGDKIVVRAEGWA